MKLDGKTIYAQSSDIKARTYLEYRKDMKRKAIAELEVLGWLEERMKDLFPQQDVKVSKAGGDKFLWFLRRGGISREPDFVTWVNGKKIEIEFQYSGGDFKKENIFDFKISKVVKKIKGKRIPKNTIFLYLFRGSPTKFALMSAEWISKNGQEGVAPAWGNREVYKVSGEKLLEKLQEDGSLKQVWENINAKLFILDFQHELININKERLSSLLQSVVDENKIIKVVPKDLESFFRICFILDSLNKVPQNTNLWLVYLLSYVNNTLLLENISQIIYCIDFLYSKIEKLKPNELTLLIKKIKELLCKVRKTYREDGVYTSSLKEVPLEATRCALFSINLLEDIIQDIIFHYGTKKLPPVKKIYENMNDLMKTYQVIKNGTN